MASLTAFQLTVAEVWVMADAVNPEASPQDGAAAPMVKLALEISKKILPTASTLMRLVLPGISGTVINSEPSLSVEEAKTMGRVLPPSVDNKMFTAVQF